MVPAAALIALLTARGENLDMLTWIKGPTWCEKGQSSGRFKGRNEVGKSGRDSPSQCAQICGGSDYAGQVSWNFQNSSNNKDLEVLICRIVGHRDRSAGIFHVDGSIGGLVDDQNLGLVPRKEDRRGTGKGGSNN